MCVEQATSRDKAASLAMAQSGRARPRFRSTRKGHLPSTGYALVSHKVRRKIWLSDFAPAISRLCPSNKQSVCTRVRKPKRKGEIKLNFRDLRSCR